MKRFLPVLTLCALFCSPAYAGQPDYLTLGLGGYDFDKDVTTEHRIDYRFDYQWGATLLPFQSIAPYLQLHPVGGFEGTDSGASYFNAGLNLDMPLSDHVIATWGEAFGLYGHGDSHQSLGGPLEFRSQFELGWRFDNDLRLSGYFSHLSNASLYPNNPGGEIAGVYLRLPMNWASGQ